MAQTSTTQYYSSSPIAPSVAISAANPNRDGTGTLVTLFTGSGFGTRVDRIRVQAIGPTTAGMVRLFARASSTAPIYLVGEIEVAAVTPSGTAPAFGADYAPPPTVGTTQSYSSLAVPSGAQLLVSTENAEAFHVTAFGANL